MRREEQINQLLTGIICEYNRQSFVNLDLKSLEINTYSNSFAKYSDIIFNKLHDIYQDVCDFSNDTDINEDSNISLNNVILSNVE